MPPPCAPEPPVLSVTTLLSLAPVPSTSPRPGRVDPPAPSTDFCSGQTPHSALASSWLPWCCSLRRERLSFCGPPGQRLVLPGCLLLCSHAPGLPGPRHAVCRPVCASTGLCASRAPQFPPIVWLLPKMRSDGDVSLVQSRWPRATCAWQTCRH